MKKFTAISALLLITACSQDDDSGTVLIQAWGEDYIEVGIPSEEFDDGWSVEMSPFYVDISSIAVDGVEVPGSYSLDLSISSDGKGHPVTAVDTSINHPTIDWKIDSVSMYGVAMGPTGNSKTFNWAFPVGVTYSCPTDDSVIDVDVLTATLTVHADHLFYDDLDSEDPGLAFSLIAQSDYNGDGAVTLAELAQTDISGEELYQVGSRDISNLREYIEASAMTLGHINGEGHCEIR